MQLAIDAGNLGSYEFNISTGEVIASQTFRVHLGLSPTDILTFSKLLSMVFPDDAHLLQDAVNRAIGSPDRYDIDLRIGTRDDAIRWIRAAGNPLYTDLGQVIRIVGVTADISEQKKFAHELTRQVKERTMELQRSNEDLLQFAHVTSHDLKEPVRKIRIYTNRISDELSDSLPEKGVGYLKKIQNATERMTTMIEGVLSYSELNNIEQNIAKIDLNNVFNDVKNDLEVLIQEKNTEINAGQLPVIEGTGILLYQLFYKLQHSNICSPNCSPWIDWLHIQV